MLPQHRLFVGGLAKQTTTESLRSWAVTNWGPVSHCAVLMDPNGVSRRFGFLAFVDPRYVGATGDEPGDLFTQYKRGTQIQEILRCHLQSGLAPRPLQSLPSDFSPAFISC